MGAKKWVVVAITLGVAGLGCAQMPIDRAAPLLTPTAESGVPAAKLEAGREVYISRQKCAACHVPKPVFEYTAEQWTQRILPDMATKAKLNSNDYAVVQAYVAAGAKAAK